MMNKSLLHLCIENSLPFKAVAVRDDIEVLNVKKYKGQLDEYLGTIQNDQDADHTIAFLYTIMEDTGKKSNIY